MLENFFRNVPDYYPTMYMDGYTPEQILYAHHKMMKQQFTNRLAAAATEAPESYTVKIKSEVKIK